MGDRAGKILAVGGHLKNTIALYFEGQIFLSQHIGDLTNLAALKTFEDTIHHLSQMYDFQPDLVVCDAHPDYQSTQFAPGFGVADFADSASLCSCFGSDGRTSIECSCFRISLGWYRLWFGWHDLGGEFIQVTPEGWQRLAHLKPFRLPGGEQAVKHPWRIALGLLSDACGEAAWDLQDLPPFQGCSPTELKLFKTILNQRVNTPLTSSIGRLFDAIASLLGLCQSITYDGEAAMRLEFAVTPTDPAAHYPFDILPSSNGKSSVNLPLQIDPRPTVLAILKEIQSEVPTGTIAAKFHHTLVEIAIAIVQLFTQDRVIPTQNIVLSGGCFQNRYLLTKMRDRLQKSGYKVYSAQTIPPNDGV